MYKRNHPLLASLCGVVLFLSILSVGALLLQPTEVGAVPSFARRYGTSCITCHVAYPRLNSFGEAFRRAGYRYPVDNEDLIDEEEVSLGHPAYANVFPDAVWLSAMPFVPPVSLEAQGWMSLENNEEEDRIEFSMANLEAAGQVYIAGGWGELLSYYGRFGFGGNQSTPAHQRYFVTLNDLLPHTTIRVGDFHPELFQRERDCNSCHFAMSRPVGDNNWGWLGDLGVELAGTTLDGRLRLVAGVLEGNGNLPNNDLDFYARVGTKIGGMRIDGVEVIMRILSTLFLILLMFAAVPAIADTPAEQVSPVSQSETAQAGLGTVSGSVTARRPRHIPNTLIYIEEVPGEYAPPSEPATVDQLNMEFIPFLIPIVKGSTVRFLNNDPLIHNVFSPDNETYNMGDWGQGERRDRVFDNLGVYTQLCNRHPSMIAYIIVLQNPYFAIVDDAGNFQISDVPAGTYTLSVWNERKEADQQQITVTAGGTTTAAFELH